MIDLVDSESDTQLRDYNEMTELSRKMTRQEDEIEMIDDEFDDTLIAGGSGEGVPGQPKDTPCPFSAKDVAKCPICETGVSREYLDQHMKIQLG